MIRPTGMLRVSSLGKSSVCVCVRVVLLCDRLGRKRYVVQCVYLCGCGFRDVNI